MLTQQKDKNLSLRWNSTPESLSLFIQKYASDPPDMNLQRRWRSLKSHWDSLRPAVSWWTDLREGLGVQTDLTNVPPDRPPPTRAHTPELTAAVQSATPPAAAPAYFTSKSRNERFCAWQRESTRMRVSALT